MSQHDKFMAVIPAYNEAKHIAQVVEQTQEFLPVLVIDDGSTDNTSELAKAAGAEVIRLSLNRGKGAAMRAGFSRVLELGCEAVITLDADGQHDPREIDRFLEAYNSRPVELIIGERDFSKMPLIRRLANTAGRWLFSRAMKHPIPDNQSGYRLISRALIKELLSSTEQGFEFEVEMLVICLKQDFELEWVKISTLYAGESSHIYPLAHASNFMRMIWTTRQKMKHT